jgi:hypothetical protein
MDDLGERKMFGRVSFSKDSKARILSNWKFVEQDLLTSRSDIVDSKKMKTVASGAG